MIIDLSNFDNSMTVLPTGQSGHVMSKHYDDQVENWIQNNMLPQYFGREVIEANKKSVMHLTPSP